MPSKTRFVSLKNSSQILLHYNLKQLLRKNKKPFEHYNKVYGKDVAEHQEDQVSKRDFNPPPQSLLQRISTKGIGVGIVFLIAIIIAVIINAYVL